MTFYRFIADYRTYGPWAIIPAHSDGKQGVSDDIQLGANRLFPKNLLNAKWPKLIKLFNLFDIFVFKLH